MIEDNKIVKSITAKPGGKSGTYWAVTWQDGKTDNIFNAEWLPLVEQSQKENRLLHFTKEKKGNYYNIMSLELAALPKERPFYGHTAADIVSDDYIKNDLEVMKELAQKKDTKEHKSSLVKEAVKLGAEVIPGDARTRSMALSYIKDIVVAQIQVGLIKEINEELYQRMLRRATEWANWISQ